MYQTWHLFDASPFGLQEPESHVQLRTHPDNPFPIYIPSHNSSDYFNVLSGIFTSKSLLALQGTGVSNKVGI